MAKKRRTLGTIIRKLREPFGPGEWQIFDLSVDPGETKDLSS